jgi:hypothetical protein
MSERAFASLDQVLITHELGERPAGHYDRGAVQSGIMRLAGLMARAPRDMLQQIAEVAMDLCRAHTVGISILEQQDGTTVFKWRAMAGKLARAKDLGMPRSPSPCGMVLDRSAPMLFAFPEAHFTFPAPVHPPIVEVLLAPFFRNGQPVGTIWVVAHDDERKFDSADVQTLTELSRFAGEAFEVLLALGYVQDAYADGAVLPSGSRLS